MKVGLDYKNGNAYISKIELCCGDLSHELFRVSRSFAPLIMVLDTDDDVQIRMHYRGEHIKTLRRCIYCGAEILVYRVDREDR